MRVHIGILCIRWAYIYDVCRICIYEYMYMMCKNEYLHTILYTLIYDFCINIIIGMGICGVEGTYRKSCEEVLHALPQYTCILCICDTSSLRLYYSYSMPLFIYIYILCYVYSYIIISVYVYRY